MILSLKVKKIKTITLVIFGYSLLTLIFSAPLITNITQDIPGSGDAFSVLTRPLNAAKTYSFENINEAIKSVFHFLNSKLLFQFTGHLIILHFIFNEPLAYNFLWLSAFVLSALSAYLLIFYLTKNLIAAFIGGFIYSFSSQHLVFSLGFGGANHLEWIPFFVLFLLKFLHQPGLKNALLAAAFYILVISNEPHFALYCTFFALILIIYVFNKNRILLKNKKFIFISLGFLGIVVVFFTLFYLPQLKTTLSQHNYLNPGIEQTEWHSADLMSFFTPSPLQVFWGDFFSKIRNSFTGNTAETTVYIGFTVMFLTIIAVINRKKNHKEKSVLFWLFNALFFSVLALGPFLHFFGELNPKIPMPYLLFYHYIPFFQNIRGTGRIFIMASLAFSVLSGYGIKILFDRFSKRVNLRAIIIGGIFLLAAVEVFPCLPTSNVAPPNFYKKLAKEPGDFKIIQPLITTTYPYATMAFYYNSYHDKQFIGNNFSHFVRPREGDLKFETETPVINDLLHYLPWGEEKMNSRFIKHDLKKIGNYMLNHENNIKYLILDKNTIKDGGGYFTSDNFIYYKNYIENNFDVSIVNNDKDLLVYEIKPVLTRPLVLSRGQNWGKINLDSNDNQEASWLTNDTTLILQNYSNHPTKAKISLTMLSPIPDQDKMFRKVNITLNDKLKGSYLIGPTQKIYDLFFDNVMPGQNIITFQVFDQNNNYVASSMTEEGSLLLPETVLVKNITYQEIQSIEKPIIYEALEQDTEDFGIIQIPVHSNYSFDVEYFQNKQIGSKKIIENDYFISKILDKQNFSNTLDYARLYAFYPLLVNHINWDEININFNIYNQDYFNILSQNMLEKYKIRYIIIDKNRLPLAAQKNFIVYITNVIQNAFISFENEDHLVFRLKPITFNPALLEITVADNWGPLLWYDQQPAECKSQCRSINNFAKLKIFNYADEPNSGTLKFNATGQPENPVDLIIDYNGSFLKKINIAKSDQTINLRLDNIPSGESQLCFKIKNKNGNIIDDPSFIKIYNLSAVP